MESFATYRLVDDHQLELRRTASRHRMARLARRHRAPVADAVPLPRSRSAPAPWAAEPLAS